MAAVVFEFGSSTIKCGLSGDSFPLLIVENELRFLNGASRLEMDTEQTVSSMTDMQISSALESLLKKLYFGQLLFPPSERRVVLCVSPFWSEEILSLLKKAFFKIGVPSLKSVPLLSLPIYCTGETSALVVDVSFTETRILPVFHLFFYCVILDF